MNKLFSSLLFLTFTLITNSQEIGFHVGGTSSNLLYKNSEQNFSEKLEFQNVYGISFGADLKINIVNSIYFSSGLNFYQNGYKSDEFEEENTIYPAREAKMNYLQIPLKFVLEPKEAVLKPSLRIGSYFSYLIGGNYEVERYPREFSIYDEFENLDIGLILGGGLAWNDFTLEIVYNLGIQNIAQMDRILYNRSETVMRNRSLNLNVIYWL